MNIELIAKTCHEVNRAYCIGTGDLSQLPWDQAPEWQKVKDYLFNAVVNSLKTEI